MDENVRESMILTFSTDRDRVRSLRLPGPRPAAELEPNDIIMAGVDFVQADIFDEALSPSGRLRSLSGAVRETVITRQLF